MEAEFRGATSGAEDLLQSFPLHRACRDGDLFALAGLLGPGGPGDHGVRVRCYHAGSLEDPIFGWTPAHWAAHNGKVECLEMLVKAGLPCDVATQGPGLTLAHVAALEGQTTSLAWLCKNGVKINAQDHMGETAAHKAVRCGSVYCLHILHRHGADFSLRSSAGLTALDVAVQNQQTQCIDYFQSGGDSHMINHMTCTNGRRKRMQASEEDELDVAKRARVENEHAPSFVCSPKASLGATTCNTIPSHRNGTANGTRSSSYYGPMNGSKKLDQDLEQDYSTFTPYGQSGSAGNIRQDDVDCDSDMVVDDHHHYSNGFSKNTMNGHTLSPVKNGGASVHTMSNGAMEHNDMVQQSIGYDISLEAMYNSPMCGHAY